MCRGNLSGNLSCACKDRTGTSSAAIRQDSGPTLKCEKRGASPKSDQFGSYDRAVASSAGSCMPSPKISTLRQSHHRTFITTQPAEKSEHLETNLLPLSLRFLSYLHLSLVSPLVSLSVVTHRVAKLAVSHLAYPFSIRKLLFLKHTHQRETRRRIWQLHRGFERSPFHNNHLPSSASPGHRLRYIAVGQARHFLHPESSPASACSCTVPAVPVDFWKAHELCRFGSPAHNIGKLFRASHTSLSTRPPIK